MTASQTIVLITGKSTPGTQRHILIVDALGANSGFGYGKPMLLFVCVQNGVMKGQAEALANLG